MKIGEPRLTSSEGRWPRALRFDPGSAASYSSATEAGTVNTMPADSPMHALQEPLHALPDGPGVRHAFKRFLGAARIALGGVFLWAFLDKLFGLGWSTTSARSWLHGGSPTKGYLSSSTGPLAGFFQAIAGNPVTDVLFMLGLFSVGLALMVGVTVRAAGIAGALMVAMMYVSHPPWTSSPAGTNPLIDDHVVYGALLLAFAFSHAGRYLGLGKFWERVPFVKTHHWAE
jgi:thiosulfate dehydrogenase [quinone] large subunit